MKPQDKRGQVTAPAKVGIGDYIPQEAPDDMLQQPGSLLLDQLAYHVTEDGADGVESLVGGADVVQAIVVKKDLLHDEDGDGLAELRARLHDAQTERNDLGGQQEVDDLGRVVLDKGANDTEAGEAEVFEGPRLGRRVQEGIEIERNVGWERDWSVAIAHGVLGGGTGCGSIPLRNSVRVSLWEATH